MIAILWTLFLLVIIVIGSFRPMPGLLGMSVLVQIIAMPTFSGILVVSLVFVEDRRSDWYALAAVIVFLQIALCFGWAVFLFRHGS